MKNKKKINIIIIISAVVIILAGVMVYIAHLNDGYLNQKQITNIIRNNSELLKHVITEIEKLDMDESVYISKTDVDPIDSREQSPYNTENIADDIEGLYIEVIKENNENTFESISNDIFEQALNIKGITGIDHNCENERCVYFNCGIVISKDKLSYYGFYYSDDNTPSIWADMGVELSQSSDNEWTWRDENLKSKYYTQRIEDNWFYYELHW